MSNKEIKEQEIKVKEIYRTPLSKPPKIYTKSGSKIEDVIEMKLDEKGNEIFYVSGQTNVYEKTQAFAEETDISNILARVLETGDTTILNKVQGSYMDLTEMPTNIFEAHTRIKEAENDFNKLPLEIRSKFDNNFNKYLSEVGTKEWFDAMGFEKKTEDLVVEKEEKENTTNE